MEEDTRRRFPDAATALVAERGFAETSVRALAVRVRTNLATVHYRFGLKDALLKDLD